MFSHEELKKMLDSDIEYYQRCLKNNSFYNTTASAEKQKIDKKLADFAGLKKEFGDDIMEYTAKNIKNGYKDNFSYFAWNRDRYYSLFHSKISNKSFRDVIYNKAVDMLCKMVAYYPKDYRAKLLREFNNSLKTLDEAKNHRYEVKEDVSKSWKPLVFFIDGVANYQFGYGLTGFLFRRVYMDGIPYEEIREKIVNIIAKIKAVDVSKNASILSKYTINNELIFCIGADENYYASVVNNKKLVTYNYPNEIAYYPNIIKVRFNEGENFYQISNYGWCNTELKTIIVDKFINIIYHSPSDLSQPINITQPQRKKQQTQQIKPSTKPQLTK